MLERVFCSFCGECEHEVYRMNGVKVIACPNAGDEQVEIYEELDGQS